MSWVMANKMYIEKMSFPPLFGLFFLNVLLERLLFLVMLVNQFFFLHFFMKFFTFYINFQPTELNNKNIEGKCVPLL